MGTRQRKRRGRPRGTGPDPTKDRTEHEAARGKVQVSSSLRDLSDEEFDATLAEIEGGSDRISGIMCATVLQNTLVGAIIRKLKDTGDAGKLFDERGPLATFEAQIMMGRALGLYNQRVEDILHIIRKVRNKFAHSVTSLDFKDAQITGWCSQLEIFARGTKRAEAISDARFFYEGACFHFVGVILQRLNNEMEAEIAALKAEMKALEAKDGTVGTYLGLEGLLNLVSTSLDKNSK